MLNPAAKCILADLFQEAFIFQVFREPQNLGLLSISRLQTQLAISK